MKMVRSTAALPIERLRYQMLLIQDSHRVDDAAMMWRHFISGDGSIHSFNLSLPLGRQARYSASRGITL